MENGDKVTFERKKEFKYIRQLGSGGTGDTHLFTDETTDIHFAIKKYVPKGTNDIDENYIRFVDEIKILFKLSHPNIVRIYNYYLYPEFKVGYLQMEYVTGTTIDKFVEADNSKSWNDIFLEAISAFEYLEKNKILHRDVRSSNILIDDYSNIKVIDFGFGKNIEKNSKDKNSVVLNWPVTEFPEEIINNEVYDHRTEIFFVGKLFQKLLTGSTTSFRYFHILDKMIKVDRALRYDSFNQIAKDISKGVETELSFDEIEKNIYREFAEGLFTIIVKFKNSTGNKKEVSDILINLEDVLRINSLEEYIQSNSKLINCFIEGAFTYKTSKSIKYETVLSFYKLLNKFPPNKKKILIDNIYSKLSNITIEYDFTDDEDVPF